MGLLVGDVVLSARELMPDLPRQLSTSIVAPSVATVADPSSLLPAGTYSVGITMTNRWGETPMLTLTTTLVVAANFDIQLTNIALIPGAAGYNVYFWLTGGGPNQLASGTGSTLTISGPGNPGVPPTRNTSFYPDADGQFVSAYTVYRWLNEALEEASKLSGGIPSMSGFNTQNGVNMYTIPGLWNKLDHGWWDGYQFLFAGRDDLWYRNLVPGVVRVGVLQLVADKIVIELQPQPNQSGGVTTVAAGFPMGAADTSVMLTSTSSFYLQFGMMQIDQEIMAFSSLSPAGNQALGLLRGMGGTVAVPHAAGAPVLEGNCRFSGMQVFTNPVYFPGNALSNLPVPSGWRLPLIKFMQAKFREAQGDIQRSVKDMEDFSQLMSGVIRGNKLVSGPRQVGLPGSQGLDTYPSAGLGGRIIIP